MQSAQYQIAISHGEALGEGWMEADPAIHLGLVYQPRATRAIDLRP
jgi:hypothetical protein